MVDVLHAVVAIIAVVAVLFVAVVALVVGCRHHSRSWCCSCRTVLVVVFVVVVVAESLFGSSVLSWFFYTLVPSFAGSLGA